MTVSTSYYLILSPQSVFTSNQRRKVIGFAFLHYTISLKILHHFFIQSVDCSNQTDQYSPFSRAYVLIYCEF